MCLLLTGLSVSSDVTQTPRDILCKINTESVILQCSHTISNLNTILWYMQPLGGELQYMGYTYRQSVDTESFFQEKITLLGIGANQSFLTLKNISPNDSAVYYCAAREHSAVSFLHF